MNWKFWQKQKKIVEPTKEEIDAVLGKLAEQAAQEDASEPTIEDNPHGFISIELTDNDDWIMRGSLPEYFEDQQMTTDAANLGKVTVALFRRESIESFVLPMMAQHADNSKKYEQFSRFVKSIRYHLRQQADNQFSYENSPIISPEKCFNRPEGPSLED